MSPILTQDLGGQKPLGDHVTAIPRLAVVYITPAVAGACNVVCNIDRPIVILSVRPSFTFRYSIETASHIVSFFITRQPNHSSFMNIKHLSEIPTGHLRLCGALYRCGIKNQRFSTDKSLYLANDTRYGTAIVTMEWNANRNSYAIYRTMPFPITLSDP